MSKHVDFAGRVLGASWVDLRAGKWQKLRKYLDRLYSLDQLFLSQSFDAPVDNRLVQVCFSLEVFGPDTYRNLT